MIRKRSYPTLATWRGENALTQEEAASRLGITQAYYSRLEQQRQFPRRQLAKRISERTGVPIETVLGIAS